MGKVYAPNYYVHFRAHRGTNRQILSELQPVHIYPTTSEPTVDPYMSAHFVYAVHYDPDFRFSDKSRIQEGDVLLWPEQYPNEDLSLSFPRINEGRLTLATAYFVAIPQ